MTELFSFATRTEELQYACVEKSMRTQDMFNGFNALSRQAVLDAVQLRCPQLTSLFNLFYTVDGACFYTVDGVVELVWSAEGVRMGCPLGSLGFDLALQGPLDRCAARRRSTVGPSLTDDCTLAGLRPSDRPDAKALGLQRHPPLP